MGIYVAVCRDHESMHCTHCGQEAADQVGLWFDRDGDTQLLALWLCRRCVETLLAEPGIERGIDPRGSRSTTADVGYRSETAQRRGSARRTDPVHTSDAPAHASDAPAHASDAARTDNSKGPADDSVEGGIAADHRPRVRSLTGRSSRGPTRASRRSSRRCRRESAVRHGRSLPRVPR